MTNINFNLFIGETAPLINLQYFHLLVLICVLVNVAFITLIERKILGLAQYRKGPWKVSLGGFLQPIADAVKLFLKEITLPIARNSVIFLGSPALSILLALLLWHLYPLPSSQINLEVRGLTLLVLLSLGRYPLFLRGWSSNRKYGIIGSLRGIAQTISYEISLALILFSTIAYLGELQVLRFVRLNLRAPLIVLTPLLGLLWFISCVAETNRTPFDFSEGESELVSGFNIEYGAMGFTLIFIAEYSIIIFFRILSSTIFLYSFANNLGLPLLIVFLGGVWIWLRATYPRYRYDKLINIAWKGILPLSLVLIFWTLARVIIL